VRGWSIDSAQIIWREGNIYLAIGIESIAWNEHVSPWPQFAVLVAKGDQDFT
jgi:hypothetical protein